MNSPDARLFAQALQALNQGRLSEAEQGFKKFLKSNPRHVGALNLYSILLLQSARFDEAEPMLRKAIAVDASSDVTFYNYGLTLKHLGRRQDAVDAFTRAIAIKRTNPEAWNNRGVVLKELGRHAEAMSDLDQAIALAPGYADAYVNLGNVLAAEGRVGEATAAYDRAATLKPDLAEAWIGKGSGHAARAQHSEAIASFERAARLRPDLPEAWMGYGTALANAGKSETANAAFANARASYQAALKARPAHVESWIGLARAQTRMKQLDDALDATARATKLAPRDTSALRCHAGILLTMRKPGEALAVFDDVLRLDSRSAEGWADRGTVLNELRRFDEAADAFDEALSIKPAFADAWLGRGNAQFGQMRYDEAIASYGKATALRQDLAEAWFGTASALARLRRVADALAAYDTTLEIRPGLAEAWVGKGTLHSDLKEADAALACFDRALALDAELAEAWYAKGSFLMEAGDYETSAQAFERSSALRPDQNFITGYIAFNRAQICDWSRFDALRAECAAEIAAGKPAATPFVALACVPRADQQFACATRHAALSFPPAAPRRQLPKPADGRIRVAYMSCDFRDHPVSQLAVGVFEHHDRGCFETIALSTGADDGSDLRRRVVAAFDQFHDVRMHSDRDIVRLIEELGCDIVVDLVGLTQGGRTSLLAARPAPVQVGWLGFAGTTGTDFIDYVLADGVAVPPQSHAFFSEKIVTLPGCYLPNDNIRAIARATPSRADQGLPAAGFVFGSFNNSYKVTPEVFRRWINLLRHIDGSVLWLSRTNDAARRNLIAEAEREGIAAERLVFATRVDRQKDHLARLRLADLFLDTPGYNAHATSCDALWAGVPVLTCIGETFAGRVAASALTAIGLPEMITTTLDDYESLALALVRDPSRLAAMRHRLASNRTTHLLFDTGRFARHLERAFATMHARAQRGEGAEAFAVDPVGPAG